MADRKRLAALAFATVGIAATVLAGGDLPEGATIHVAPLTKAMWNQGRHYNRMCPTTDVASCCDGRMWAGCTAIAAAIILDYYQWPLHGTGDTKDLERYWDDDTINLRARFDVPYDWSAIREVYGNVVSARESMAVATLVSDVGAVLNMNYGSNGSSAMTVDIPSVFGKNFFFDNSYSPAITEFNDENVAMIQMQLLAGHPIPCAGAANSSGSGHSYVCDGYATTSPDAGVVTNLYHFNFGWGGMDNGWYPLDAVFTTATPGAASTSQPVSSMYLNTFPRRSPQFVRMPQVVEPDCSFRWGIANCWTNYVERLVLEHQRKESVPVNDAIVASDWFAHAVSDDNTVGWEIGTSSVSGRVVSFWGSNQWPGMGNALCSTKGVPISEDTSITISYKAVKFPSGVVLKLATCMKDPDTGEWSDQVPNSFDYCPEISNLDVGTSTSALTSYTTTISGADIIKAIGGASTDVHFALKIDDPNYSTPTFATGTEIFRLESFTITGYAEDWSTFETRNLDSDARSVSFAQLGEGSHRMKLTAKYSDGDEIDTVDFMVSSTLRAPSVVAVQTNGSSVVFEVSDAADFSYDFEYQSNALNGSPSASGNRVTWTFNNALSQLGTHWLTLTVSNKVNGLVGKCVHITNPPEDHPLSAYCEETVEAAAERAKREGKLVLLVVSGDPDSTKFKSMSGILSSNDVVTAIAEKYIVVEAIASTDAGYSLGEGYWRSQPQTYGYGNTTYQPAITAYAMVINPTNSAAPYACDALPSYYMNANSRWNYFNSQLDLSNLGSSYYVGKAVTDLAQFMSQEDFVVALIEPTLEGAGFVITESGVYLDFEAVAGQHYTLLRGTSLDGITNVVDSAGASVTATSDRVQLSDTTESRPKDRAFYRVRTTRP